MDPLDSLNDSDKDVMRILLDEIGADLDASPEASPEEDPVEFDDADADGDNPGDLAGLLVGLINGGGTDDDEDEFSGNPRKYHHVGILPTSAWKVVGTKALGKTDPTTGQPVKGIKARFGLPKRKAGRTRIVSLLFDPRLWTMRQAEREAEKICERQGGGCRVIDVLEATSRPDHKLSRKRKQ